MTQPETLPLAKCRSKSPHALNGVHVPVVRIYPGLNLPQVACNCGQTGAFGRTREEAIELWNALCSPDKPEAEAPVESAPALAPFEKLVEELRAEAEQTRTHHGGGTFRLTGRQRPTWSELSDEGELLLKCADRLSAVVEEVRGK